MEFISSDSEYRRNDELPNDNILKVLKFILIK